MLGSPKALLNDNYGILKVKVYLIQAGGKKGAVKIGVAKDVHRRLSQLQTGNHLPLNLIAFIPCENRSEAEKLERWLHYKLRRFNIQGEWFSKKVNLKYVNELANDKGYLLEEIPSQTYAERLISKLKDIKLNEWEIGELYYFLKDQMEESEFTPIDDILDNKYKKSVDI